MSAAIVANKTHTHITTRQNTSLCAQGGGVRVPRAAALRATSVEASGKASAKVSGTDPLLLRAVRGEEVERPPVWMMRQAGRYMKSYQELCKKYPSFRERSEIPELSIEISLQPWKVYKPDGVILFSDILTPLEGMNIDFDFLQGKGPEYSVDKDPVLLCYHLHGGASKSRK